MGNLKTGILLVFSVLIFSACKKDSERLPPALENQISQITYCECLPYFAKYSWKGEIVYLQYARGAACSAIPFYYDKNGYKIQMETGYTLTKFLEEATLIDVVWECRNAQ